MQQRRDARWTIAGKEPGCLFYFILHTGFVGADQHMHIPLHMMDRACKNKKGEYHWEGESTLSFATVAEASVASGAEQTTPGTPSGGVATPAHV